MNTEHHAHTATLPIYKWPFWPLFSTKLATGGDGSLPTKANGWLAVDYRVPVLQCEGVMYLPLTCDGLSGIGSYLLLSLVQMCRMYMYVQM